MSLQDELGFLQPIENKANEAVLNIILTGTLLAKEGQRVFRPLGLTLAQFNVLILLKHQSVDGRINQTTLGKMMLVNRSNITGLVDRMEQAGLVRRADDPEDRRVHYVEMTETGGQILEKAHKAYYSSIEKIMSALSGNERKFLSSMLESVRMQLHWNGKK